MNAAPLRRAAIHYNGQLAGVLSETPDGYEFAYDSAYLLEGRAISVSLPLREAPYRARELFSFFTGLTPEGWYLDIVSATAKVDPHDAFGMLLATAPDTVGAVTVHPPDARQ